MARYIDQSFMLRKLALLQKMNPFEGCSHNHSGSEGDQEQKMGLGKWRLARKQEAQPVMTHEHSGLVATSIAPSGHQRYCFIVTARLFNLGHLRLLPLDSTSIFVGQLALRFLPWYFLSSLHLLKSWLEIHNWSRLNSEPPSGYWEGRKWVPPTPLASEVGSNTHTIRDCPQIGWVAWVLDM